MPMQGSSGALAFLEQDLQSKSPQELLIATYDLGIRGCRRQNRALVRDVIELVVQVNGKLRARVHVPANAGQEDVRKMALADENVTRHVEGKTIKKIIVVPGKLVNIVVVDG